MNFPRRSAPATAWMAPASATAAKRYSGPCDATSGAKTTAVAPAAPEMTPGCAPSTAVHMPMRAAAWSPTMGDTPATNVNANDSGTIARDTVIPARTCVSTFGDGDVSFRDGVASSADMAIAAARSCAALASTRLPPRASDLIIGARSRVPTGSRTTDARTVRPPALGRTPCARNPRRAPASCVHARDDDALASEGDEPTDTRISPRPFEWVRRQRCPACQS